MRQRKIKNAAPTLLQQAGVIIEPVRLELPDQPIVLEIGSGKGDFIIQMARDYPDKSFYALEINANVLYRILQKKEAEKLNNLTIILGDANDLLTYFAEHSIAEIYLNFSDPWPKKRHHKRRLTYKSFLELYKRILKGNGFIQFRTDHLDLFAASIESFDLQPHFILIEVNYDLPLGKYVTEYEQKKRPSGPIYQLRAKVESDDS
ncbi:MAG: tRNA (guanosine(46)-N7)-methyltransferase TrmB [Acholeplasmataceae bacterium]